MNSSVHAVIGLVNRSGRSTSITITSGLSMANLATMGSEAFSNCAGSSCRKGRRTRLRRKSRSAASETEKTDWSSEQYAPEQLKTYPGSMAFVRWVRQLGLRTAVVSSSHHCATVLQSTGIEDLFDAQVDGNVIDRLRQPGKPAPDVYLHAARLLGVSAIRAVVVEDAIAGVRAGRAGGFGLVIGVDRGHAADDLLQNGANLVVSDLGELVREKNRGQDR